VAPTQFHAREGRRQVAGSGNRATDEASSCQYRNHAQPLRPRRGNPDRDVDSDPRGSRPSGRTQDGHTLSEWGGHSGSGLVSCTNRSGSPVYTDPIFAFTGAQVHPGRVRITMTVQSYSSSVKVTVTRWATIPG